MRITKWGECGALCCIFLGRDPERTAIGATEISEALGVDIQYLQQVLQRLRKGGLIASTRGSLGGYALARPPKEISLRDILFAAEGSTFDVICDRSPIFPSNETPNQCSSLSSCALKDTWQNLQQTIDTFLSNQSLEDLVNRQKEGTLINLNTKALG